MSRTRHCSGPRRILIALGSLGIVVAGSCSGSDPRNDAATLAASQHLVGRLAGTSETSFWSYANPQQIRRRILTRLARTGERHGPREEAVIGLLALYDGQPERAAELLSSAHQRSGDWRDANDLAVSFLESHRHSPKPFALMRALEALGDAANLAPGQPEVTFNLALVLSSLHLRRVATRAWQETERSGDLDRNAVEARLRALRAPSRHQRWLSELSALENADRLDVPHYKSLVEAYPQFVREYARLDLVGRWSESVLTGDRRGAEQALARGELIGKLAADAFNDRSLTQLYSFLRGECDSDSSRACATAHRDFAAGVEAFHSGRADTAERLLPPSVSTLRSVDSPLLQWAEYFLVYATFHRGIDRSRQRLERMLAAAAASGDPLLMGRLHWRLGVALDSARDPAGALQLIERGTELICVEPDDLDCAFGGILASEAYDLAGDLTSGWEARIRALDRVMGLGTPRQVHSTLSVIVHSLVQQGYPSAAGPFVGELALHARETGNPEFISGALRDRGKYFAATGHIQDALADFESARAAAAEMGVSHRRNNLLCTIDLEEGGTLVVDEPARAVRLLDRALRSDACSRNELFRLHALSHRAKAYSVLGDAARSESDLLEVLALFEEQRRSALDGSRYLSLVAAQPTFDELVGLLVGSGRAAEALTVAERSRNRFLLETRLRAGGGAAPLTAEEIGRGLPEGTVLVQLADLGDGFVAWVVEGSTVRALEFRLDRGELLRTVAELRHGLARGRTEEELRPQTTALFRMLFHGLGLDLKGIDRLVVVPDRALVEIPFGALRDPRTGRHVIEDVAVVTTPSSSLVMASVQVPVELGPPLIVAAPDLTGTAAEALAPLAGALEEGRMLAEMFPGSVSLTGARATRSAFLSAARSATFIHFAGHALAEPAAPFRSRLPFAREPGSRSFELDARAIGERRLGAPLVVLAGCSTLEGFAADRENLLGLAGAFYAAGSGAVVATLGPAEDGASQQLMRGFYGAWSNGSRPSAALRSAVLRYRSTGRRERPMRDWANFVVLESIPAAAP